MFTSNALFIYAALFQTNNSNTHEQMEIYGGTILQSVIKYSQSHHRYECYFRVASNH